MAVVFGGVDGIVDWSLAFCIYLDKTFNGTLESHFSLDFGVEKSADPELLGFIGGVDLRIVHLSESFPDHPLSRNHSLSIYQGCHSLV